MAAGLHPVRDSGRIRRDYQQVDADADLWLESFTLLAVVHVGNEVMVTAEARFGWERDAAGFVAPIEDLDRTWEGVFRFLPVDSADDGSDDDRINGMVGALDGWRAERTPLTLAGYRDKIVMFDDRGTTVLLPRKPFPGRERA